MPFDSHSVGTISIDSEIDLSGYLRSKQKLIADAAKMSDEIGQRLGNSISSSFSGAGKGLADGITRDFPRQGLQIQNSLGGTITGAILRANFATAIASQIVGGVTRAGSLITRPLQDIVSTITGSIGQGLDFGNAARIRTEVLSTASALSGVAEVSFEEAEGAIESLNQSLAASAAALPGSTNAFLEVARQVSDEIARVAVDAEGIFDPQRWEQMTSQLATSATVLGESSGVNAGLTAMGLSRALSGSASQAELRNLNLFQNNPTLLAEIDRQLQQIGAESLRDVTAAGRVNILQAAFDTVVTPELIEQASNSAEGLIESFKSRLGDPTTGLFSISRELAGGTSVFDELTNTLRITIGEGEGLLDQLISSAETAGLTLTDPMESLRSVILRVNEAIARLAENADDFFSSDIGQGLIDIVNTIQTRVPQAFGFLVRLGSEILPVVITGLQTVSRLVDSAFSGISAALPDFSGIGLPDFGDLSLSVSAPDLSGLSRPVEAIADALSLARDHALSFFESFSSNVDLSGFFEAGSNAIAGFNQLLDRGSTAVSNFISENGETIQGVGETIGGIFGSAVSSIGDLTNAASRTLIPVLQQGGELLGGVFGSIWEGTRGLREWFASDETRVFLSGAIDGLTRIGEIILNVIGFSLSSTLEGLDRIFVKSGLLETLFKAISVAVGVVATGIGGLLNLVGRWEEIIEAISGAFSAIVNILQQRLHPATEAIGEVFDSISETVQSIWDWLNQTLGISERLAGPFEAVRAIAEQIAGFIADMFGGLQRVLGLGGRGQQAQTFAPGGAQPGAFVSPIQGQSLQQVVDYQQTSGQDFDAYRAYRQGYHAGIDFDSRIGGGEGGIVQSVTDGVVTEINELFSNAEGAGGSVQVRIETTDSTGQTVQQRYTHLSRQAVREAGLQVGQQVSAGQVIGAVGSTDSVSSGAHLDYKVTVNGQFVNPDEFLNLAGAAGQLTTLDVRSGRQGQVNIGAIAPQTPGIGQRLGAGLTQASAALGQNIDPVYSGLQQRFGGDQTIAAGFFGNFMQESGLDPTVVNPASGSSGLAQWLGSRLENLKEFSDQAGTSWTDLDTQLDFVLHELQTTESEAWRKIQDIAQSGGSVAQVTTAIRRFYERPGEHEANDPRRIAAAEQAFAQGGGAVPGGTPVSTEDLQQFLDPTQRYARELQEAERLIAREGQLRAQAREEEDRERSLALEQQLNDLRAQQAELDPRDAAGSTIIDARIREIQTLSQESDRLLSVERQITDLVEARRLQSVQRQNLEGQRAAFEQAQATGAPATTTEQELKKLEAEISPINFDEAIASLEEYGEALEVELSDKLRPIQASLSRFATQAVEDSESVLRSIENLNRQYGEPSAFEQHQAGLEQVSLAYEENGRNLDQNISRLEQLSSLENLTEDQYSDIAQQIEEATQARKGLNAAEERAIELANEAYESQQRLATIALVEQLMEPQLRAAEAEAQSIERFDQFGANVIRRQAAIASMRTRFAEEIEAANSQTAALIRQFEQAQAVGDQASLDRFQALGIGSVEDIQGIAEQNQAAIQQVYQAEFNALAEQFPTLADAFRSSLRDATSQGLTQGLTGLATGQLGIGEAFQGILDNLYNTVISSGAQRLSDMITGGLFGNGEGGGLLDGLFGANEDAIPGQAQQASAILGEGGLTLGQTMIDAASTAASILNSVSFGVASPVAETVGGVLGTGGFGGGLDTLDVGGFGRAAAGLLGGGEGEMTAGEAIAQGFAERMPEAGNLLAGGNGQGFIGKLIQGVGGLFGGGGTPGFGGGSLLGGGGGGGGGILGTIGGLLGGLFYNGGLVRNYAGGGIAAAMSRERSQSGRKPRLAVVNDGEYIFSAGAVSRIGVGVLESLHNGGPIVNYSIGGSVPSLGLINPPEHGQFQIPEIKNAMPKRIEYKFQSEVINNREYVSKDQLDDLQAQVNEAPRRGAEAAIEAFRSNPSARTRAGF